MTTALATAPDTIADLLHRLGDIPPERIPLDPPPGKATEADLAWTLDHGDARYELVHATLVRKPMGFPESLIAGLLHRWLSTFVDEHDLGISSVADGALRLRPGSIRIPDVAFISWDRLPNGQAPDEQVPTIAPDLAIEILSPGNTAREMEAKRADYFAADVRMVWEIDPQTRTAVEYRSDCEPRFYNEDDILDGGDVVPGFSFRLADLLKPRRKRQS